MARPRGRRGRRAARGGRARGLPAPDGGCAGGEAVRSARGRGAGAQREAARDLGLGIAPWPRARDADGRLRRGRGLRAAHDRPASLVRPPPRPRAAARGTRDALRSPRRGGRRAGGVLRRHRRRPPVDRSAARDSGFDVADEQAQRTRRRGGRDDDARDPRSTIRSVAAGSSARPRRWGSTSSSIADQYAPIGSDRRVEWAEAIEMVDASLRDFATAAGRHLPQLHRPRAHRRGAARRQGWRRLLRLDLEERAAVRPP